MIQRIQTIFLFLASGTFFGQFWAAFAKSGETTRRYFEDSVYNIQDNAGLLAITVAGAVLALATIFLFKNRKLQMTLTRVSILLAITLPVLAMILFLKSGGKPEEASMLASSAGMYLPVVGTVMLFLASKYIKKDDKLVRSMDRLR